MQPLIGIPCHNDKAQAEDYPPRFVMSQGYVWALQSAGAIPILIPLLTDQAALRDLYERLDGLLLAGGGDLDPSTYGEHPHPKLWEVDLLRDRVELTLARWAMVDDLPILAVCRGIQTLNVAAGGSLYQDVPSQCPSSIEHNWHRRQPRNYRAHTVEVAPGSRLAALIGAGTVAVNSLHHQAVKEVGQDLTATAVAPDGLVEAIESTNHHFVLGVQWHPEVLAQEDPRMQALFDTFVAEARRRHWSAAQEQAA
jgi:putative glutamine amidotransferase